MEDVGEYLFDYGLYSLHNSRNLGAGLNEQSYWLTVDGLELGGRWKVEWSCYIRGLTHGGIRLNGKRDSRLWMHNPMTGEVTTSLAYDLIVSSSLQPIHNKAISRFWTCAISLKIQWFLWLVVENNISTWDNLQRKG